MFKKNQPHSIELFDILRRAPLLLNRNAQDRIADFISGQLTPEGGFSNRAGVCDQYYTMFALACAASLKIKLPLSRIKQYLLNYKSADLDLIHLVCLVKSILMIKLLRWPAFYPLFRFIYSHKLVPETKIYLERFHSPDGGFSDDKKPESSNPYSIFMGLNLYQDCGTKISDVPAILASLKTCRKDKNSFHNPSSKGQGMLLSSSAAVLTMRQLTGRVDNSVLDWIAQQQGSTGGFHASPKTSMPDLLSTAVALFTLRVCGYPLDTMADSARQFILDHWHENGGFTGTLVDDCADCEYTFYALMALGALSG